MLYFLEVIALTHVVRRLQRCREGVKMSKSQPKRSHRFGQLRYFPNGGKLDHRMSVASRCFDIEIGIE